jgi:hypothetical protein
MKRLITAMILLIELISPARAAAIGPTTYTVEPFDFDGVAGITMTVTQLQFGGRYCRPCVKIPYPADGTPAHNQLAADNIGKVKFQPGDMLLGFSLGAQNISLAMSQGKVPGFVNVVLAGDTFARNDAFNAHTPPVGIPANTPNSVLMVVNEFDGYSDLPTIPSAPGYGLAWLTAGFGTQILHYYRNANPDDLANVVTKKGNIKAVLVPTLHLPQNAYLRAVGMAPSQAIEDAQHIQINTAYARAGSTPAQRAAATSQQVPFPAPAWVNTPEAAATIP